jgi:hypothetical protein
MFKQKASSESCICLQEVQFIQRKLDLIYSLVVGDDNLYKQFFLNKKNQCLMIVITAKDY